MNLIRHHRIHIPNSLAIIAVLLLLVSTAARFETTQSEVSSGQENSISVKAVNSDSASNPVSKKSRGLNLGLLLFRRG
ncbi:MAG TPA: hypothetical protein VIS57_06170 [Xanthomonadales bacterium]